MPRTVLRQFTGGLSDEIDPQNLREDQGEESLDINLKGFALEPGAGLSKNSAAKHYHYRGEWIKDSRAVSFEESGIGVVKTYDDQRPQFEEIINDKENVSRDLGPPLPPPIAITGSVVSEGTRGARPAKGSHLLEVGSDNFGVTDTADPITDAPSLKEHYAAASDNKDDIYYYSGQAYWIKKVDATTWQVQTKAYSYDGSASTVQSGNLTHFSGGYLFKENYFICWDAQYIETVALSSSTMTPGSFNTFDTTQHGDAGSSFGFTAGATAVSISSVDICNAIISFTQKLRTTNTTPTNGYSGAEEGGGKHAGSDNERWVYPVEGEAVLVLIKSEKISGDSESDVTDWTSTTNAIDTDDDCEVWINGEEKMKTKWLIPKGGLGTWRKGSEPNWKGLPNPSFSTPRIGRGWGFKYAAFPIPEKTWSMVKYVDDHDKPQIHVLRSPHKKVTSSMIKEIEVSRSLSSRFVGGRMTGNEGSGATQREYLSRHYFQISVTVAFKIPSLNATITWSDNGSIPTDSLPDGLDFHYYFSYGEKRDGKKVGGKTQGHWATALGYFHMGNNVDPLEISSGWAVSYSHSYRGKWKEQLLGGRGLMKNKIIGTVPSYINRLCSFTPGNAMTQHVGFAFSKLWTKATISGKDKTITFPAASDENFTIGDYIKISAVPSDIADDGDNRRTLSWNKTMGTESGSGENYFVAKIINIDNTAKKLTLEPEDLVVNLHRVKTTMYDEDCYPVISALTEYGNKERRYKWKRKKYGGFTVTFTEFAAQKIIEEPVRKIIQTDLYNHILIGHHTFHSGFKGMFAGGKADLRSKEQIIEVRHNNGDREMSVGYPNSDWIHSIDWRKDVSPPHNPDYTWENDDVRAVTASDGPRIFYTVNITGGNKLDIRSKNLYSQIAIEQDISPSAKSITKDGTYYLTSDLVTVVDSDKVSVYDTSFGEKYVHSKPELSRGLGIIGKVQDAMHVSNSSGIFVFIKVNNKWKLIRTSDYKTKEGVYSETSVLDYDFVKPITYDTSSPGKAWGIYKDATDSYDIHIAVPFFVSDFSNSLIYYADDLDNPASVTKSAWGEVMQVRDSLADASVEGGGGMSRYLSVDWKYDSQVEASQAPPVIGLNDEDGKLTGDDNEFDWYLLDAPDGTLHDSTDNQARTIDSPSMRIRFKSRLTRDVVFFNEMETVVPSSGATGEANKITFINYAIAGQSWYVVSDKAILLKGGDDAEERGYQLIQAAPSGANVAFDASRVGLSSFLVGSPNMYNPNGPNLDFYYRASFIDKWGNESVPSSISSNGIGPLDSSDDCIQLDLGKSFFRQDNTYIEKIRLYRYGGDSSSFLFLRDMEMPDLTDFPLTLPGSGVMVGSFRRTDTLSSVYDFRTFSDISKLSDFTNSNFEFEATPDDMDGQWVIIEVSEMGGDNGSPSTVHSSELKESISATDTSIELDSTSNFPPTGLSASVPFVVKIGEEYVQYNDLNTPANHLGGCVRGYYGSEASSHEADVEVQVVEWSLKMEHRNQDTTILLTTIDPPDPSSVTVKGGTEVFQAATAQAPKKFKIGNEIFNYTGITITNDEEHTFTGVSHNSSGGLATVHTEGATVYSHEEVFADITSATGVEVSRIYIDQFGFRDKSRTPIMSLHRMQEDNYPPIGLEWNKELLKFFQTTNENDYFKYIKAVGSMYFAALDSNLRFSRFGTPEYWPLDAVLTLDSDIRAITEHSGEGLVFTTNSLYRVRGTDPKGMVAFRVPDAHGMKAGDEHTLAEIYGGVLWLTPNDGVAMYQSGRVTYLTRDKHSITDLVKPYACASDGIYWLFQRPEAGFVRTGYRLEITGGDLRLCETSIEAYYAYYAESLGKAFVVTSDGFFNSDDTIILLNSTTAEDDATVTVSSTSDLKEGMSVTGDLIPDNTTILKIVDSTTLELSNEATAVGNANVKLTFEKFEVEEVGGELVNNLVWRSKKIDTGEPAIPKAFGSLAIVYEALDSKSSSTLLNGIRGQALLAWLLDLDTSNLDAGDLADTVGGSSNLFSIFTKYDEPNQTYVLDLDGEVLDEDERKLIVMPLGFDTNSISVGDSVWNEFLADNTTVSSITTAVVDSVTYPAIGIDKEPLKSGSGIVHWGNLPVIEIFLDNEEVPARTFTLPPADLVEPQSMDLYLNDLRRFRTISVQIQGNVRVLSLSLRHYPLQDYQAQTLHHSADVFYKGEIDFRVLLDGNLIYRKELKGAEDEFEEQRVYLPASAYGQRVHYMNESRGGMIESVKFNGSVAA